MVCFLKYMYTHMYVYGGLSTILSLFVESSIGLII